MSTLRINNIEAQSVPASPTIDEKVKVTNSSGDILVNIDGKTSGITTIGINTTDGNIKFDANSNVLITGILTATTLAGNFTPDSLEIGSNIKLGNAGVITATSFVGSGAASLSPSGNADELVIGASNGTRGITIFGATSNIFFGDSGDNDIGQIQYEHSDNSMRFNTNASERLRIQSDGTLVTGAQTIPTSSDIGNIYIKNASAIGSPSHQINYVSNAVFNGSWKYITSGFGATQIIVNQSYISYGFAGSGTAGNNITFSEKFRIKNNGDILTQGLTSPSFDNQGTNGRKYEFTGDGTAGKFPVINISGNSNTEGGTIGVLRFVNRENANSSSGGNNQSRGLVEFDCRSTTSDSNAGDDSGGYLRFITKSEEGQMGERFVLTARGSFKSNGRHNLGGIREITSGTLANGESVSWNGSGTTYTNAALNWNSIGGNGGAWIGSLSVLSADQAPSGAMVLVGCHGSGFNNYNMLVNNFDGGISVTPTGTGHSGNYWNSVISNTSGETIYYRMLVYHLGASSETIFGL